MKTRNLVITLSIAALAAVNVMASEVFLTPRAAEHQTKTAAPNTDPNLAAVRPSGSPRAADNQIKTAAGKDSTVTPSLQCTRYMKGTPKIIGACADHPGAPMACCSVAGAN